MDTLQATLLGILQGVTEFLPISSSGHLAIVQHYWGIKKSQILFDVLVHAGTLGSVFVFFRKDIFLMLVSLVKPGKKDEESIKYRQLTLSVLVGTIPTCLIGLVFYRIKEVFFLNVFFPSSMLILTGIFLLIGEKIYLKNPSPREKIKLSDALFVGFMQGIALIPGISRSGITISSALSRGVKRELSFLYSFLLFIPAAAGASILEGREIALKPYKLSFPILFGTLIAFLVGLLSLFALKKVLQRKKLTLFSFYCWIVGGGTILLEIIKMMK